MAGSELARIEETYDPKKYLVLHPVTITDEGAFSPVLRESVSIVQIKTDKGAGEVYNEPRYAPEDRERPERSKFALTQLGLAKIAAAAGIKWVPEGCGVQERERRPDGSVYIRYRATGAVRQPNGEWHLEVSEKEIDTADEAADLDKTYRRKLKREGTRARFKEADIPEMVEREIAQLKKFLLGHAETKAKNRVIRRLVTLQQTYTAADLVKPFVIPRLIYRPDLTDPRELERVQLEGRRAAAELYGGSPPVSSTESEDLAEVRSLPDRSSATGADAPAAEEQAGEGEAEVVEMTPTGRRTATSAKPQEDEGPKPPAEDPIFEDGPHKGERMSRVAEIDPSYLRGLLQATRARKKQEVIQGWLDWSAPTLGSGL